MVTWIQKEDFEDCKGDKTYKIKCPGTYKLKENIYFSPKKNKVAAILIDSNDVILDLNGKFLKQSKHCKHFSQVDGVVVKTGHRNVSISNGSVQKFSQRGVYVEGGNKRVTIEDLTVTRCGKGTETALVDKQDGVEEGVAQAGLQLGDMKFLEAIGIGQFHGILETASLKNVTLSENNFGCALGEGSQYEFVNCSFSNNVETRLMWEQVSNLGGFYAPKSVVCYGLVYFSNPDATPEPNFGVVNAKFADCKFNSNLADASETDAQGAYCDAFIMAVNFKGLKIQNSEFNSNEAKLSPVGEFNQTRGLVLGAGAGTVVEDSEFLNNVGGSIVNGFNLSGLIASTTTVAKQNFPAESVTLRNCVAAGNLSASNVATLPSIEVIGFSIRYPSGVTMIDCVAENNRVVLTDDNKDTTNGFADGIFIFSALEFQNTFSNNIEIRGCKLSRNRVVNGVFGTSSGVRVFDDLCENVVIRDSIVTDNRPDKDEPPAPSTFFTTGVELFNESVQTGSSFVSVLDNVIQNNGQVGVDNNLNVTNVQGNKITSHDVAVLISESPDPLCGSVLENTFLSNDFTVVDVNVPSTTLVAGNKGYNNPCGYSVEYEAGEAPAVASSTLPSFPAFPTVAWSNIDISNTTCGTCVAPVAVQSKKVDAKQRVAGKKELLAKRKALYKLK